MMKKKTSRRRPSNPWPVLIGGLIGLVAVVASALPGQAICYECEPYPRPSGGGTTTATGTTVKGTFLYRDQNSAGAEIDRPIAHAKVEIWRYVRRNIFAWGWGNDRTLYTDASGSFSFKFGYEEGAIYAVRVFASNAAATVWPIGGGAVPFFSEADLPEGTARNLKATFSGQVLSFDYTFADTHSARHYNLAETSRHGFDFVNARRGDTDPLPAVNVQPVDGGSWYYPPNDTVNVTFTNAFADDLILHEYGHFVEEQIAGMPWIPAHHDGCTATGAFDSDVRSPEHAWLEGFADFFAHAVIRTAPHAELRSNGVGTPSPSRMETPSCPDQGTTAGDAIEIRVAGVLWDLFDQATDPGSTNEATTTDVSAGRADTLARMDAHILSIMDRELDPDHNGGANPTIAGFRSAWLNRGLPADGLDAIFERNGVPHP